MRPRLPRSTTLQALAIALTGLSSIVSFPTIGPDYSRFAMTLLAGAAWVVAWAAGGLERLDRRRRLYLAGIGAAALSVVVSAANARFPALAFTFGGVTGVSAPYWIALLCIMGASSLVTLGRSTLLALRWQYAWLIPVAVVGALQALSGSNVVIGFVNIDYFAPMMLVFAPVALGLAAKYPEHRRWWIAAAAVLWLAMLATRTLSGLFGLGAQIVILALFVPKLMGLGKLVRVLLVALLLASLVGFMVFGTLYLADALPEPLKDFATSTVFGGSSATRAQIWSVAWNEFKHRLLTGVGPDAFSFEGQRYVSEEFHVLEHYSEPGISTPFDPHSLMILLAVDFGLIGVAAALLIALGWARGVLSAPFKTSEGHLLRWSFALGALGFGYATAFTPFPLYFGGSPMMIAGLALVRPPEPRPWPPRFVPDGPRWFVAIGAVLIALGLGAAGMVGWGDYMVNGPLIPEQAGPFDASRIQPQVYFYRYADLRERGRLLVEAADPDAHRAYQEAVDEAPPGVRQFAPVLVELVRLSIDHAFATGRADLSWESARLEEAAELSPTLPELHVERAHLLIAQGDLEGARRALDASSRWKGAVPQWSEYDQYVRQMLP